MDISQDSILEDFNEEQEVEIRPGRSRSFPVDPQRQYHQLSPQSSTESEQDDFCMQRGGSFNEEARPGMKGVVFCVVTTTGITGSDNNNKK